ALHAALRACGPTSAISHYTASEEYVLVPFRKRNRDIDVTIAGRSGRDRPDIRIHRPRFIDERDITTLHGMRITTVARTLPDLSEQVDLRTLERAVDEALVRHLTSARELHALLDRSPGRRGRKPLRLLL